MFNREHRALQAIINREPSSLHDLACILVCKDEEARAVLDRLINGGFLGEKFLLEGYKYVKPRTTATPNAELFENGELNVWKKSKRSSKSKAKTAQVDAPQGAKE